MTRMLFILMLILATKATAGDYQFDSNSPLHVVTAAAVTGTVYLVMSKFTGGGDDVKGPSLLGAVIFSSAGCLASEIVDTQYTNGHKLDGADLASDGLGIALMATAIYLFDIKTAHPHPKGIAFSF